MMRVGRKEYKCSHYDGSVPETIEENAAIEKYLEFTKTRGVNPLYCFESKELEFSSDAEEKFYKELRGDLASSNFLVKTIIDAGKLKLAYFQEYLIFILHERLPAPEDAIEFFEMFTELNEV